MDPAHRRSYLAVLGGALACYAALGAVLRLLPHLALGSALLGLAVGAPALTPSWRGRSAAGLGPEAVFAAAVACAAPVAYSSIPSVARSLTLRSRPPV